MLGREEFFQAADYCFLMRTLDHILHLLSPDHLAHLSFELTDRLDRQHVLGFCFVALCTLAFHANVGQAGIGTINQAKVSNNSPVPPNAVIAQPQMLFLFLDQHFNSPAFEVMANYFLHGKTQIVGDQCDDTAIPSSLGENNLNAAQFVHGSNTLSKLIAGCFPESMDTVPAPSAVENVPAIRAHLVLDRIDGKPTIGLANADIAPFPFFAGVDNYRTKIEGIKQNGDIELSWDLCAANNITSQRSELLKGDLEPFGMLFLHIQPGAKGDRHPSIKQAGFEDRMSIAILSSGMVVDLSDRLHFLGPFDGLRIINNQQALFAPLLVKPFEHSHGLLPNDSFLVKLTSPKEFAMIGSVRAVPKQLDELVKGGLMAHTNSHDETRIVGIHMGRQKHAMVVQGHVIRNWSHQPHY